MEEANSQVRRIAILVTSLDATAGRQLLMAMPSELARDVRRAMTRLSNVDPDEQRRILAEFRNQAMSASVGAPSSANGKSSAATAAVPHGSTGQTHSGHTSAGNASAVYTNAVHAHPQAAPHHYTSSDHATSDFGADRSNHHHETSSNTAAQRPWQRLDVATLTRLLRGERATVIAVVLSQLDPRQAAALLEQLPRQQHREIISTLATLGQIDPEAMSAIDDHLASRIADYHHRDSAESETVDRLQLLLSAAPDGLRGDWQEIIRDSDAQLAQRMGIKAQPIAAAVTSRSTSAVSAPVASPTATASSATATPAAATPATVSLAADANAKRQDVARAPRPATGNTLIDLLANNVVTTADSHMPPAAKSQAQRMEDEPHVLPFPGVESSHKHDASKQTSRNGVGTSAARAVGSAASEMNAPPLDYPDVVLGSRARPVAHSHQKNIAKSTPLARFEHILDLPAELIGQLLAEAETEIVLLALAGASPAFMQRFTAMLERQDARALKARIRELGSINLQDVDEAQRRMCELAIRVVEAAQQNLDAPTVVVRAA